MSILGILNLKTDYHASQTASVFASDITRRLAGASALQNAAPAAPGEEAQAGQARLETLQKLESALAGTVNYMVEEHGEQAGTAMMALMYKSLGANGGESAVTEESLGRALLDVTRFIDKNFGFAAGDSFMGHLNGSLNRSMNEYFDNGLNESFFAVTNGQIPASAQIAQAGSGSALEDGPVAEAARQLSEAVLDILDQARQGNENRAEEAVYGPRGKRLAQSQLLGVLREQFV